MHTYTHTSILTYIIGILHIIMGYCEGGDLCTRLKSYQGILLSEHQVVEWFVQIALALQV